MACKTRNDRGAVCCSPTPSGLYRVFLVPCIIRCPIILENMVNCGVAHVASSVAGKRSESIEHFDLCAASIDHPDDVGC